MNLWVGCVLIRKYEILSGLKQPNEFELRLRFGVGFGVRVIPLVTFLVGSPSLCLRTMRILFEDGADVILREMKKVSSL
jgi:hypothetical protein